MKTGIVKLHPSVWPTHSFHRMHSGEVALLIADGQLAAEDLVVACEALGASVNTLLVRATLTKLLEHASPAVREAAIRGLTPHLDDASRETLKVLEKNDPSAIVKAAAWDALAGEDLEGDL